MSPSKHSRAPDSATCAYVYARGATTDFQLAPRANQIKLRSHLRDLLIEVFDLQSRLVPALQRRHHVTQFGQQSLLSPPPLVQKMAWGWGSRWNGIGMCRTCRPRLRASRRPRSVSCLHAPLPILYETRLLRCSAGFGPIISTWLRRSLPVWRWLADAQWPPSQTDFFWGHSEHRMRGTARSGLDSQTLRNENFECG